MTKRETFGAKLLADALRFEIPPDGMLRREDFTEERVERFAALAKHLGGYRLLSREERQASLERCLADVPPNADVWIFGYGSLMWNPAIRVTETCSGLVRGYHRRFCLEMLLGRGSLERPGLMLGLDRGGSCRGLAHRIAAAEVESELTILWRREMTSGAYRPHWVTVEQGDVRIRALTFVANREHARYAGKLPVDEVVMRIASAEGQIGSNRHYLYKTVEHLDQLGICDGPMHDLARRVRAVAK
jgi:glutathione-specific gamma-glutamylcyclotransferase